MKIHFKITTWEEVDIPKKYQEKIIQGLKDGSITSVFDLYSHMKEVDWKVMEEVEEYMSVEENQGNATIEIKDDDGNYVWNNTMINEST